MCMTKKVNMVNVDDSEYPTADREYKDRLFRLVFNNKEDLLSLYNAVAGAQYEDPDELEINTLGNVLYLSMKNDISFLVSGTLNLYEHQSTYNPNMPMRGVLYFARLYGKIIAQNNINIYSSSPRKFPFPQHIVFYNGTENQPDRTALRSFREERGRENSCAGMYHGDAEYQLRTQQSPFGEVPAAE